jgi:hypothetical protein
MAELITFKCTNCQHVLKIGAEKAGRKAKCPKCGQSLTIPGGTETGPKTFEQELEEGKGIYGFADEPVTTAPKIDVIAPVRPGRAEDDDDDDKPKGPKRDKAVKQRALLEPERWKSVKVGLQIIGAGYGLWLLVFVMHVVPFLIGVAGHMIPIIFQDPASAWRGDYAELTVAYTKTLDAHEKGEAGELGAEYVGKTAYAVGLLSGKGPMELNLWVFRVTQVFMLVTSLVLIAGYCVALPVPERFGTKKILIALIAVGGCNLLFQLVFKLLPLTGVMNFTLLMLVTPEMPLVDANIERTSPLHEFWSDAPFWECLLALLLQMLSLTEPVLYGAFLRAIALQMKSEELEGTSRGMIKLGLSQVFIQLVYLMLANTGTTDVLIGVLRALYTMAHCFMLGQLIWFIVVSYRVPALLDKELDAGEEEE